MDKYTVNIMMSSEKYKTERIYWMDKLQGEYVPTGFPTDNGYNINNTTQTSHFGKELSGEVFERIMQISNKSELGIYIILVTAIKSLLYIYNRYEDIIVGMPVIRTAEKNEINSLLPLRTIVKSDASFKDLLNDIKSTVLEADAHKNFPMDGVAELLGIQTNEGMLPDFRTVVLSEGIHDTTDIEACGAEMVISLKINESSIGVSAEYKNSLFEEETVSRIFEHIFNLLGKTVKSPETKLSEIDFMSDEEKNKILFDFNNTAADYCREKTVHKLFEEQVDRTPDNIAVQFNNNTVTYKELDDKANTYANYLLKYHNLKADSLVGVMLDKSDEMIAVTLGILKAGGAYVPIDPGYPEERIRTIIDDSGINIVVSCKEHIKTLNKLQWECNSLQTFLCVDSSDVLNEEESEKSELMGEDVWKYVGSNAKDDIEGGAWVSSYTGENLSERDMGEYSDNVVEKLRPYLGEKVRVLEIGCASGLSMYKIAPHVGLYYGTDLSEVIIERNRQRIKDENIRNIKLSCLPAHGIDQIDEKGFDIIILNSVVQCFHGHNYLRQVIAKCIHLLNEKGIVFVGDVMDQELKSDLIESLTTFKQNNSDKNYRTKTDWSVELFLSKGFFEDLRVDFEDICSVNFSEKIHTIENELTQFRYDTILHIDKSVPRKSSEITKHKLQHGLEELRKCGTGRVQSKAKADSLAYVIYTSGTTGKPKGAMIEHRNVVRLMVNSKMPFDFNHKDVWTMFHSYCFDFSVWEMYGALLYGGKLIVIPKTTAQDTASYLELLKLNKVTVLNQTPSAFYRLVDEELISDTKDLCLRYVIFGGEALKPGKLAAWYDKYGETKLVNMYGITETTVHVTYKEIGQQEIERNASNIGKPIPTLRTYVMSETMRLLPFGAAGELCVGGDGVCRGYLNRAELTKEKFVENPYKPGERLYRSGDLVKLLPNGDMQYLGRIDQQVKIRGHRIELREVESALLRHDAVSDAIVIDKLDDGGDKYLCAYLVSSIPLTVSDLRVYLSQKLPEYAIPSYFVQIEEIPMTSNGKVNKKALPNPLDSIQTGVEYLEASSETEKKLVDIWKTVLKVSKVGIMDNFFELGGHSLKATTLIAMIHKEFDVEIPLSGVFQNQTVKELAALIEKSRKKQFVSIEKTEEKEYYGLSSAQKRIYVLCQMNPMGLGYNIPVAMKIDGEVDKKRIEECLKSIVQRHEVFRTVFETVAGEPVQKVSLTADISVEYFRCDKEKVSEVIQDFIKPFDLTKAPLLRVGLIELGKSTNLLMFDMHHIISDGTSLGILVREFVSLYEEKEMPPLKIQYKDFAAWQNNLLETEAIKKQEEYWINRFSGEIPVLNMPTDYARPSVQSFAGDTVLFTAPKDLSSKLNQLASSSEATLYMVLNAAYNILLSKYTCQEDIIVGSSIAGRQHADTQNIVGMFVNVLAMRNYPKAELTFRQFLEDVKQVSLEAYENQDFQFEELVDRLNLRRDLSRNPLFDTVFSMQNMDTGNIAIEGLNFTPYEFEYKVSKFDLTLYAAEERGSISFRMEYSTGLFKRETIERMASRFVHILMQLTENPDVKLYDIELATDKEKQQILTEFNNTHMQLPTCKPIHELFEEQCGKTPDNTALVFENYDMSYRELNEKSNCVARVLREKGVQLGDIAAVIADPSFEMFIGILGILKAGAAYLPIDPDYPEDRIRYMLKDSRSKLMLGTGSLIAAFEEDRECIRLDDEQIYTGDSSGFNTDTRPEDLAYIIYTSGSTGKPKGVMVEHKALVNLCYWHIGSFSITSADRSTKYAGFGFDASVWEIFPYLISGAAIHIISKEVRMDVKELNSYMEKNEITVSFIPTHICEQFVKLDNKSLRKLLTGGDYLKYHEKRNYDLINNYGPTENTVVTTSCRVNENHERIPIGKPISNCQVYILDRHNKLLPSDVQGELCISGDGLARGYLNLPELTKEKFVPNPYAPGKIMYRSGDLARWLPDGNIEFLGRIDQQVKIRGFRIELGEIESQLLKHEQIKEAVVITKKDRSGNMYLCAYLVTNEELQVNTIKEHLLKELPEYMLPSYYIRLEKLPLTPNGKLDRNALPEPDGSISTGVAYEAPTNSIEKSIAAIWQDILSLDRAGLDDNFFDLGGHSLSLIKVHNEIDKIYPGITKITDLFAKPTIRKIAELIENTVSAAVKGNKIIPIELSPDYLSGDLHRSINGTYKLKLDEDKLEFIKTISENRKISNIDVLMAVYIYLLAEITQQNEIMVLDMSNTGNMFTPIAINKDEIESINDLFEIVNKKHREFDEGDILNINDIRHRVKKISKTSIIPAFVRKNLVAPGLEPSDYFDLILEFDEYAEQIYIKIEFGSRISREKGNQLINGYVKLLKLFIDECIKEQAI